jgi:phage-related minor tail protein
MTGGSVPGSGDQDTVPRTLDAGAFVLRKAAVRKYGGGVLSKLANGVSSFGVSNFGVARFATGGKVTPTGPAPIKYNRDAAEAKKMIDLGLEAMREYTFWMRQHYGAALSIGMEWDTMQGYGKLAATDRQTLESIPNRSQLTANEKQKIDAIKQTWRTAMAQPLVYGKDIERDLLDYMEQHQGEFYRGGGVAKSDTVPAMLTPGEYVVNRSAVSKFGAGFFESLNNLSIPAQALARGVQGQIQGFASGGLVQSLASPSSIARPALAGDAAPVRTVRVELAAGNRSVSATVDARDETRLLDILKQAKSRAF